MPHYVLLCHGRIIDYSSFELQAGQEIIHRGNLARFFG